MLQGPEILVILLVALVVFGPERLPEMARRLGRWTAELRDAAREVRAGLQAEVEAASDLVDEVNRPLGEATSAISDTIAPIAEVKEAFDSVTKPQRWVGPKPQSGPGPDEAMKDLEEIEGASRGEAPPEAGGAEPAAGDGSRSGDNTESATGDGASE